MNSPNYTFDPRKYTPFKVLPKPMTDSLRKWVAENKMLGIPDISIVNALVANGINAEVAHSEIQAVVSHPYFQAGHNIGMALKKVESHLEASLKLAQLSPKLQQVERRSKLSKQDFLENYYATNTPVILTDMMGDWKALSQWTPDYLKVNYGKAKVEIQANRQSNPLYEIEVENHKRTILLSDYVDMVVSSGETNDFYMVANNKNIHRDELRSLLDDIKMFPDYLDANDSDLEGKVFFWFGPAGTVTPLHHDPANLMMAHVYGRKHWRLISPDQIHLLYNYRGVFSQVDLDCPDYYKYPLFKNINIIEVTLEPGEVIFIPVGWWHHVKSLDISISMSFTNFLFPNHYEWHYPQINR